MPSTLIPMEIAPSVVVIDDDVLPLGDAMDALMAYRSSELPVPAALVNSVRAYRLGTLADAIERYNDRVATRMAVATG